MVTIITVCLNDLNDLIKTINSVNSFPKNIVSHIIIDGDSTDGSKEWLKSNQSKFYKYISEKDAGIYDAMNKGIDLCPECDYILFLNAGDVLVENFDTSILNSKYLNDFQIIFFDVMVGKEKMEPTLYKAKYRGENYMPGCHQGCLIRYELIRNNKFDLQYKVSSDFDFWKKSIIMHKSKYICINNIISITRPMGFSELNRKLLNREYSKIIKTYNHKINYLFWHLNLFIKKVLGR